MRSVNQIPLDKDTAKLTKFITPCGQYFYWRLPHKISSAPEIFKGTMEDILHDQQDHVICFFDDIFSKSESEHTKHLKDTFTQLHNAGVKLNRQNVSSGRRYCSSLVSSSAKMERNLIPRRLRQSICQTQRTWLNSVISLEWLTSLADMWRTCWQHCNLWLNCWRRTEHGHGDHQINAMAKVRKMLTSAPTLAYFNPEKATTASAGASSYGQGAVLLKEHPDGLCPVAFTSRALTKGKRRYAQIECLAATWVCEKFNHYLVGLEKISVVTDHKPLVPLINTKDMSQTPLQCQRMLMVSCAWTFSQHAAPILVVADITIGDTPRTSTRWLIFIHCFWHKNMGSFNSYCVLWKKSGPNSSLYMNMH